MFWLWTLLVYWLVLFVGCLVVVQSAQGYFYDGVAPYAGPRVAGATLVLAALLTWRSPLIVDMFTSRLGETALLAILGFVIFTAVFQFHPPHAALIGPVTVVILSAAAALAVESLADGGRSLNRDMPASGPPIRKSVGGGNPFGDPGPPSESPAPAPAAP